MQLSMSDMTSMPNSQEEDDLLNRANIDTIAETQEAPSPNTFSTQIVQKLQIRSFTKRRIADAACNNNNNVAILKSSKCDNHACQ